MIMLKALRHRPIRRLWVGQALSSIGDEIYRVGLTWIAVGLIGADTGYLTSAQCASLMILSFVGGKWAENWDALRTMIRVDIVRALIVLIPVMYSFWAPVPLMILALVAVTLSGLGAFFDPALQTTLPKFSPNAEVLRATNGLMMTTIRLARMVGPGIVGLFSGFIAPIHFFTMDALTFLISAGSLRPLQHMEAGRHVKGPRRRIPFREAILAGFHAIRNKSGMRFLLYSKAATTGSWNLAYGLGFALLVQEIAAHDTRSFGLVIASYGAGNFAGALYFGNIHRPRPAFMMYAGYVWMGLGFVVTAFCHSIPTLMVTVAVTGFSGTMNEVTFFELVQKNFAVGEITRIFRLRMALDTTVTLTLMLIAPLILRTVGVRPVISFCGMTWVAVGLIGLIWFQKLLDAPSYRP
jgi:DHA3 family macrolide efflux protein-like MFS transporter